MKTLTLLFLCLTVALCPAAITERYVNNAGSGAADGTTEADGMSFVNFNDYMVTGGSFTATAGDRFNVKKDGTMARTTNTDTWVNGGTVTSPVIVRGYKTTIGDGYVARSAGAALSTANMPVITYTSGRISMTGTYILLESADVSGAPSAALVTLGVGCVAKSCKVVNSSTNASAAALTSLSAQGVLYDCDIALTGASGGSYAAGAAGTSSRLDSCRITVVSSVPAVLCSSSAVVYGNLIFGSGGIGISMNSTSGSPFIRNNTIVGCAGDGIDIITGTTVLQYIVGNMITDNTGVGIDMVSAANAAFLARNRTRDNSSAINSGTDWVAATSYSHVTTDTGAGETDYTNAGSSDYTLIVGSPATSTGVPASASIGALQRVQTGGGGQKSFSQ